ncbi:MAG: response regulator [Candidatus Ratteibacteria bacterium]|nr:response regulator [Candidatus Ratteibacteria bacterium]
MGKKIMIVDDDKEFSAELSEILESKGYEIIVADNQSDVLGLANHEKPNLILMDIKMPDKSGFELAAEIKYSYKISHIHIPIIAMSAHFKEDDRPLMEMCGITSRLKKPFTPVDVITEIENVLGK